VTNDLGHRLAQAAGDQMTLGAYRRGNRQSWLPGALIDTWVPCARGDAATGVAWPHVYFIQTIGERSREAGSIFCPECRVEMTARRAAGTSAPTISAPLGAKQPAVPVGPAAPQSALPF
jgi:hypothetical protein